MSILRFKNVLWILQLTNHYPVKMLKFWSTHWVFNWMTCTHTHTHTYTRMRFWTFIAFVIQIGDVQNKNILPMSTRLNMQLSLPSEMTETSHSALQRKKKRNQCKYIRRKNEAWKWSKCLETTIYHCSVPVYIQLSLGNIVIVKFQLFNFHILNKMSGPD